MAAKLIKTAEDHAAAITRLSELMDRDPAPGGAEADEMELLGHLIELYEKKHHDIGQPDPLTATNLVARRAGGMPGNRLGRVCRDAHVLDQRRGVGVARRMPFAIVADQRLTIADAQRRAR